jgi:hypothetical protein
MKIKEGFVKKNVGGTDIVVAVGEASLDFNAMITLNGSGAFLWSLLENDVTEEELVSAMVEKYDIDKETAKKDISAFLNTAKGAGVIE